MSEAFGDQKSFLAAEKVAATEKLHFCSGKKRGTPRTVSSEHQQGKKRDLPSAGWTYALRTMTCMKQSALALRQASRQATRVLKLWN